MKRTTVPPFLALWLAAAMSLPSLAGTETTEYARGRGLLDRGDAAGALDPLAMVRWHAENADLRRLAAVGLSRCESSLPDSFRWGWAVLPADNLGSPAGLGGLGFSLSWLLRDDLQAAGLRGVAPLGRVVRALDRSRQAGGFETAATAEEASQLPIQTVEGLKARLSMIPGPTGKPLYAGPVDGEADPALVDAVRGLQSLAGMEPTGEADAPTMGALAEVYERRLLEPPPAADPTSLASLAAAIPAQAFVRPTMRIKDGRLVFGIGLLDDRGRSRGSPVEAAGPLEETPQIVRDAARKFLELLPPGEMGAAGVALAIGDRLPIDPSSSPAALQEAGRWALLRSRGETSLARTRGEAIRYENPGWDRVAVTVDADEAGASTIAQWERTWRRRALLQGAGDERLLIEGIDRFVSDLPSVEGASLEARRGAARILGEEGRLHIEGHFP